MKYVKKKEIYIKYYWNFNKKKKMNQGKTLSLNFKK